MGNIIDYQWPSPDPAKLDKGTGSHNDRKRLIDEIELFFSSKYNCNAILMPSGRSSISHILRYLSVDRSNTTYISKWSSMCLYSCIGPYCNVSTDYNKPNVVLVNHQWGNTKTLNTLDQDVTILEDSVDTIHVNDNSLFKNNGLAEIVSLPKIIGAYSGAIVLTREDELYKYSKLKQNENLDFGSSQAKLKRTALQTQTQEVHQHQISQYWACAEYRNTSLDMPSLSNINNCLTNYQYNISTISKRRLDVVDKFSEVCFDLNRLGPVCVFDTEKYKVNPGELGILVRNYNISPYADAPMFKPVYLLPMHYAVDDCLFHGLLDRIYKR